MASISPRLRALIWVLTVGTTLAGRSRARVSIAACQLPGTARRRSWVSRSPSMDTDTEYTPASAAREAMSGPKPRPPVTMVQRMPAWAMAAAITCQSGRR